MGNIHIENRCPNLKGGRIVLLKVQVETKKLNVLLQKIEFSNIYILFVLHFGIENKGRKRFVVSKPEIAFFVCRGYFHHTLGWQRGF